MTTNDITVRPAGQAVEMSRMREASPGVSATRAAVTERAAAGLQAVCCPRCGAENERDSKFCAVCGAPLEVGRCPHCGSAVDADADVCEVCHRYIRPEVCSFCGAPMSGDEQYCPECGSPRGGIVCPVCRTLNDFAFCKQCGTPLTDEARALAAQVRAMPEYQSLRAEVRQLTDLQAVLPFRSERDVVRERMNVELRERVLMLLAEDEGKPQPVVPKQTVRRLSAEELEEKREAVTQRIAALLDKMALPPQPSPVKARNWAMAQKPAGMRLAWVCNFKHAMHASPCGCAKPQLGGKWVILGKNENVKMVHDK